MSEEVTIAVFGPVSAGKSALCAEIEKHLQTLGVAVTWVDGDAEKNLNEGDWQEQLKKFAPVVKIVEKVVPKCDLKFARYEAFEAAGRLVDAQMAESRLARKTSNQHVGGSKAYEATEHYNEGWNDCLEAVNAPQGRVVG